ncbi:MAG: IclR family transcriptional regulator [Rhizobiaceae bacterium]|nr:IclR family transcriptional regulator [Rhizobiaceae bacterium]
MDTKSAEAKQGLERSFAVLDLIAARPCRVVDVMRDMGLPWATAHRTVKKLEKAQFLMLNPETSHYEIGPRMWHLGSSYLANNKMLKSAISYLAKDRSITGVDVQVVERIGSFSVVIHAEKRQVQEISKAQYGYHIPLHAGSKGLVLLAYESPEFLSVYCSQPLEQLTPLTITEPDALRKRLAEVRAEGFAQTEGDVQTFTGSIAAPVFSSKAAVVGCICFVYLKKVARDHALMDELKESLLLMSHSLSAELGWHPGLVA